MTFGTCWMLCSWAQRCGTNFRVPQWMTPPPVMLVFKATVVSYGIVISRINQVMCVNLAII